MAQRNHLRGLQNITTEDAEGDIKNGDDELSFWFSGHEPAFYGAVIPLGLFLANLTLIMCFKRVVRVKTRASYNKTAAKLRSALATVQRRQTDKVERGLEFKSVRSSAVLALSRLQKAQEQDKKKVEKYLTRLRKRLKLDNEQADDSSNNKKHFCNKDAGKLLLSALLVTCGFQIPITVFLICLLLFDADISVGMLIGALIGLSIVVFAFIFIRPFRNRVRQRFGLDGEATQGGDANETAPLEEDKDDSETMTLLEFVCTGVPVSSETKSLLYSITKSNQVRNSSSTSAADTEDTV